MSCNLTIHPQSYFSFSIGVEQYELGYWFFRKLNCKIHTILALFHIFIEEKSHKIPLTIIKYQNLPNLQNLDVDSQISHFEWTLHNSRRDIQIGYPSDAKKNRIVEYRRYGNQWKNNHSLQLQREKYDKLLDMLRSLLDYVETFTKSGIIIDECTVENDHTENECKFRNF